MRIIKNIDTFVRLDAECIPKGFYMVLGQDMKGNREIMNECGRVLWITRDELNTTFFDPPTDDEIKAFMELMTKNLLLTSIRTQ
jgi:hypothetical protein